MRVAVMLVALLLSACGESPPPAPAAPAVADLGAKPQPIEAVAAPVRYTPPAGRWLQRSGDAAPGQWFDEYTAEDGSAALALVVFPVRDSRDPLGVFSQALDTYLRGRGTDGFGLGGLHGLDLWGAPAAQASWTAVVNLVTVQGEARLLRATRDVWALAVGYAAASAGTQRLGGVRAFAASLEPVAPHFYARRFGIGAELESVLARAEGEEPVTLADLMAVELVLEAGVGARYPLSIRSVVEGALREDVQGGSAQARASYRETRAALAKAQAMPLEERLAGMRALGQRALEALLARATEGYAPAARYAGVWRRLRAVAVGTAEDGLTVGDVQCLHEMCSFLVSLGADREVPPDADRGSRLTAHLQQRWAALPAAEKEALRASGATWAALRRDWDRAEPGRRDALRYAVLKRIVIPPGKAPGPLWPAQRAWERMRAVETEALEDCVRRALDLTVAERAQLAGLLGQERSSGWDLGW